MKRILLIFVIWFTSLIGLGVAIDESGKGLREVEDYISWFHQDVSEARKNRALKYAPYVLHYSEQYNVDPLLVAVIISCESSWIPTKVGDRASQGLMQVQWWKAKRGFDMSKPEDQIHAGVKHLRHCFDLCDNRLKCAVHLYATGNKRVTWSGLNRRIRLYNEAIARHRK